MLAERDSEPTGRTGRGQRQAAGGDLHDVQPHHAARLQDPKGPLANGGLSPVAPRTAVAEVVKPSGPSSLLGFFLRLSVTGCGAMETRPEVSYLDVLPTAGWPFDDGAQDTVAEMTCRAPA